MHGKGEPIAREVELSFTQHLAHCSGCQFCAAVAMQMYRQGLSFLEFKKQAIAQSLDPDCGRD
jgi:hypothetical protein